MDKRSSRSRKTEMIDEPITIRIIDLKPQQPIIVRASTQDADGKLWQSYAGFHADEHGGVNLSTQAPVNGTYTGIDPTGLIRSMNLPGADYNRARFTYRRVEPLTFNFRVDVDGWSSPSATVSRRFMPLQGKMSDVRESGLVGTLFTPPGGRGLRATELSHFFPAFKLCRHFCPNPIRFFFQGNRIDPHRPR